MNPAPKSLWTPNANRAELTPTPRQQAFLASRADEALYGGAASGGKSLALLLVPLRWIDNGNLRVLYLRRESTYLGDAIDKSKKVYSRFGARLVRTPRVLWTFPSGAEVWFGHCQHEADVANYDGFEFNIVLFDELTHFTEKQYLGIQARLRTTDSSLPTIVRAGTNPGGTGHRWVMSRWGAWLDAKHSRPAAQGERRWYVGDTEVPRGTPTSLSRTFVPAKLEDNPHVAEGYDARLAQLPSKRRAQLRNGLWVLNDDSEGALWKRAIIEPHRVITAPDLARIVVAIDPAGSRRAESDETGIVVAGVTNDGHGYVLEDHSGRYTPGEWAKVAVSLYHRWRADRIVAERNFGGDMVESNIRTVDPHAAYKSVWASRGKALRAEPVVGIYEQGRVHHVGPFTDLEEELCTWEPLGADPSPNRLDALVWALTELMVPDEAPRTWTESYD